MTQPPILWPIAENAARMSGPQGPGARAAGNWPGFDVVFRGEAFDPVGQMIFQPDSAPDMDRATTTGHAPQQVRSGATPGDSNLLQGATIALFAAQSIPLTDNGSPHDELIGNVGWQEGLADEREAGRAPPDDRSTVPVVLDAVPVPPVGRPLPAGDVGREPPVLPATRPVPTAVAGQAVEPGQPPIAGISRKAAAFHELPHLPHEPVDERNVIADYEPQVQSGAPLADTIGFPVNVAQLARSEQGIPAATIAVRTALGVRPVPPDSPLIAGRAVTQRAPAPELPSSGVTGVRDTPVAQDSLAPGERTMQPAAGPRFLPADAPVPAIVDVIVNAPAHAVGGGDGAPPMEMGPEETDRHIEAARPGTREPVAGARVETARSPQVTAAGSPIQPALPMVAATGAGERAAPGSSDGTRELERSATREAVVATAVSGKIPVLVPPVSHPPIPPRDPSDVAVDAGAVRASPTGVIAKAVMPAIVASPGLEPHMPPDTVPPADDMIGIDREPAPVDIVTARAERMADAGASQVLARADGGPRAMQQVADAARHLEKGPVELALDPEELGRVRMTLVASEGAQIAVMIAVERPETMELLRRHIEILAQEFRSMGYDKPQFSFAQQRQSDGQGSQASARSPVADERRGPLAADQPAAPTMRLSLRAGTGVDIRL